MDVLSRAHALEAAGRRVVHLEIGEPDFTAPEPVVEAGVRALREGRTAYTATLGLPAAPERAIGFLLGGRDGRLLLVTACALVGRPAWGLVAITVTAGAALATRLVLVLSRAAAAASARAERGRT